MDLLQGQLNDGLIDQLANQIGGDKQQTKVAAEGALSTLLAALSKNARSNDGASALSSALDRDHDGSVLEDLMGMMSGQQQQQSRALNGAGILKHVLGGNSGNVIDMISKMSGLGGNQTGSLLAMLAPLVMGTLGKQKRERNLNESGLSEFLQESVNSASNKRKEMGLIGKLLDQDGDGSVIDDIAGMFGKFLRK